MPHAACSGAPDRKLRVWKHLGDTSQSCGTSHFMVYFLKKNDHESGIAEIELIILVNWSAAVWDGLGYWFYCQRPLRDSSRVTRRQGPWQWPLEQWESKDQLQKCHKCHSLYLTVSSVSRGFLVSHMIPKYPNKRTRTHTHMIHNNPMLPHVNP